MCIAFTLLCRAEGMTQDAAAQHIRGSHGWVDALVGKRSDGASATAAIKNWEWALRNPRSVKNPSETIQMAAEIYRDGIETFDILAATRSVPIDLRAYVDSLLAVHHRRR